MWAASSVLWGLGALMLWTAARKTPRRSEGCRYFMKICGRKGSTSATARAATAPLSPAAPSAPGELGAGAGRRLGCGRVRAPWGPGFVGDSAGPLAAVAGPGSPPGLRAQGSGLGAGASHHEHPVAVAVFGEPQGQPSSPALPALRLLGILVAQPCAWRKADTVSVGGGAWGAGSGSRGLGHKPPWQEGGMPEQSRGQRGQGGPGLSRSGQGEGLVSPRQGSRARSLARSGLSC